MSAIRPLRRDDLPQVASLYERVARSGAAVPPPGLAPYFAQTFLDHPSFDSEIPSLVHAAGDGSITGFLGSHSRRLRFDGEPIRFGCAGQFVVDPVARRRGVGALLLRHYLAGPQDLTTTDSGSEEVRLMWERLGGSTAFLQSVSWTRALQPWHVVGDTLRRRSGRQGRARVGRPLWTALDGLAGRLRWTPFRVDEPRTRAEELTAAVLVEHLATVKGPMRLRPDHTEASLRWLLEAVAAVRSHGTAVQRLVRDRDGRALGWYVAYLKRGGVSQVLQVGGAERDVPAVIDHLFHDAQQHGATALQGRLEPLLFEALSRRRCLFRQGERVLVHARNPEVALAVVAGGAMLTRLEGEWWMGHHVEPFDVPAA